MLLNILAVKDNNMGFSYKKNIGKGYQMKQGNSPFKMSGENSVNSNPNIRDASELFKDHPGYNPELGVIVTGTAVPVGPKITKVMKVAKVLGNFITNNNPSNEIVKPLDTERIASYKFNKDKK